jgi:two-component system NtrC family sensor kinase
MVERADARDAATQNRHTVAGWLRALSLRVRLLLVIAAIVGAVVTAVAVLEVRSFERTLDQEIEDAARLTARAVADELRSSRTVDPSDIRDALHDLAEANSLVRSISVIAGTPAGPELVASTLSEERADVLALSTRAIASGLVTAERRDDLLSAAAPMRVRDEAMAAVATVSLAPVQQVRERGRAIALVFTLPVIVIVTWLVDLTVRALVHRPIADIRETMHRAALGQLGARASVMRNDELGAVSAGLNEMLVRLEGFNAALHERVREATDELRTKNVQLGDSYYQLLMLREALARAERMAALGHMAASVAHQAGTPLNLVSGYVQMVRADSTLDPQVRERLLIVETQIQQVTRVLRTMLDQARQPLQRERTSVAGIVERVCDLAAPRAAQSDVRVERVLPDPPPVVDVDVVQFELVLLALVSNGLDAMPHGGTLTVSVIATGPDVRIEVADTGPGIPADRLDRIFEPWMTTKPAGHGTGLGLGIARDVISAHGGTIVARNRDGGGAVFIIGMGGAD